MNSNSYLGMGMRGDVITAEEATVARFGAGPGAVRFISGTYETHIQLERRLAAFHGREAGMIFSAAYVAIMGTIAALVTKETVLISDELNHNCIINAMRLSRPCAKAIYPHLDYAALEKRSKGRREPPSVRSWLPTGSSRCAATTRRSTASWRSPPVTTMRSKTTAS